MADTDERESTVESEDFDGGSDTEVEDTEGEGADEQEQEPRSYSEDELHAFANERVTEATRAVQSTKDRRIASLEAQIRSMQASEPVPQFRNEQEELRWHREQRGRADAIRSTEANIASALAGLSDEIGVEIKRDDERLDTRTRESFETSLAAIKREETLRKQVPTKGKNDGKDKPKRRDVHRYDGGSGGARETYDPKKYENSGNVYEALRAKGRGR